MLIRLQVINKLMPTAIGVKKMLGALLCATIAAGTFLVQSGAAQSAQPQQPAQSHERQQTAPAATRSPGIVTSPQMPKEPPRIAPGYEAPMRPLPSAERIGIDSAQQVPLGLSDAIALALANNKDINASRIDVEIAGFDLRSERGVYDPRIVSGVDYNKRATPSASFFSGGTEGKTTQTDVTGSARLAGNSPLFGGNYLIDFTSGRTTTDNQFTSLNPQYPSALTFTYTQPLLRGLRIDENRRRIEIAKRNLTLSDLQFRQRAIETITRVQQAYWDLVFALRNLQVQIDAVAQARRQVESNRRQVQQGTLAPIDIVAAETQVSTFEQDVYSAQEAVTRAENNLKSLMLPDRSAPLWSQAITPTSPVTLEPPRMPLDQAVTAALGNRLELEQVATSADINRIDTRFFRDQTKPQVDLVASYSAVGLAGTAADFGLNPFAAGNAALLGRVNELSTLAGLPPLPQPTDTGTLPNFLIGGAGQSLTNLFGLNFPTARVGITFSFPVGNRTAEANLGRSLAEGRRIKNQREQLEQQIEVDVRNTLQSVRSVEARLAAAAAARSSAEQQSESEQRRFEAGLSTVFLVLQRQTELIAARGRELQAQTDLNRAIAEFQRATGSTLQVNNIVVRNDARTPQLQQTAKGAVDSVNP